MPFGLIKAIKNPNAKELAQEDIDKAKNYDLSIMGLVPYHLVLCVMPLNFLEFWPLMQSIDQYKGNINVSHDKMQYEKTKWKLAFDKYLEKIPDYYNDYINSYLKHLRVPSLYLKQTDTVY